MVTAAVDDGNRAGHFRHVVDDGDVLGRRSICEHGKLPRVHHLEPVHDALDWWEPSAAAAEPAAAEAVAEPADAADAADAAAEKAADAAVAVSYTHLTLPTIYSV